ncbi:heavy-metal-associated domain-containing protein [Photobacterium damselae subsp. damselae]|uniref:Uncharacterized protein n=1 Tax=Photobacterium damselae TaxID=38293 RepID=A0A2T3QLA8_PHODM|nr:heavy-metal-associated domain-containing protein [Photobacterium damselae]KAB1181762.1 cation transporter [Photobacterium damselae subsp. damselae]MBF7100478.1 cation transporter [Photobacterium damselae]PSW85839.1 cation transporter [Photobacterium damselae]UKA03850.1 heavy-metal-associated domain-containing protein [Photobacterium damselae subsp. damselae]UKA27542.1 heavy-metal-associated domain-containing protein [Photobacterium damselae subsp. damselae]
MRTYVEQALKLRKWVTIGHHIPGRIRLKYKLGIVAQLASFRKSDIEKVVASIPAFTSYTVNNATGSIVIEYDYSIVKYQSIDELFSESEQIAERACYAIAQQLNLNGERS